jgi:hemoglobin/transferrin/lactoferrin receptor protein
MSSSDRRAVLAAATACCLALSAQPSAAATADELETIVVTAQREPGNLRLSGDQLLATQASRLADIFANESSVAVGGGSTVAQKIYVRGFEDVMLNVTVDGAQSPGELYHHQGRVQLEPEFIKSLELDAGAGAATNGAGALTGALRTTLKDAFDLLGADERIGAYVKGTGWVNGDDGHGYTASAFGRLADDVGLVVALTDRERDDYEDGNGDPVEPSSYDQHHGYLKLSGNLGVHTASLTYERLDDEATTYERPNLLNYAGRFLISDQEMSRETLAGNYGWDPDSRLVNLRATLYGNTTDFRIQRQATGLVYGEGDFDSVGFDLRNTSVLGRHALTYGVDYRDDEVVSAQNATPPTAWGTTRQNASVLGLYAQDNWQLLETVRLSAGLRFDDYEFESKSGVSAGVRIADSGFSPNVGLTWEPVEGLELRTTYAQAFRGVTIREAFFSALYVHDGSLESEQADNLEFGISYEHGRFFARGTVYRQHIQNFIDVQFLGTPVWGYWRNIGDAQVEGYELETGYAFDAVQLSLGVWEADNSLNDQPLADANLGLGTTIGRTWLGKANGRFDRLRLDYGAKLRYVEEVENTISPTAPPKEAYFVADVYLNWQATDHINLALAANNLFDEFYYDHATYTWLGGTASTYVGYPAVGREWVASLSYRF